MQENLLNLPKNLYGNQGIEVGNTIVRCLKEKGMELQYNSTDNKIIILNSSLLDPFSVQLKLASSYQSWKSWTPIVLREKNGENLQIRLKAIQGLEEEFFSKLN